MIGWQPMDTAPRDGRDVLLKVERGTVVAHWMPGGFCIEDHPAIDAGWYFDAGTMFDLEPKPFAWMPAPGPAPAAGEEGA